MTGMFGGLWVNHFGEWDDGNTAIAIWGAALRGLSEDDIKKGLAAVSDAGASAFYPVPTAPQFKELCRGPQEHPEHVRMSMADKYNKENRKRLRADKADPVKQKAANKDHMKKLRGDLKI